MPTHQGRNSSGVQEAAQKRRTPKVTNRSPVALTQQTDLLMLQRAVENPGMASPEAILALQGAAGNRAVSGLLVQAKLVVGPVGDRYEQEADRVADQVMSMQLPSPGRRGAGGEVQRQEEEEEEELQMKPLVQRAEIPEEEELLQGKPETGVVQRQELEEEELQMKPLLRRRADGGFQASADVERRLASLKGSGSPLPEETRADMESRFGADFSAVRVHTDGEADRLNRDLKARAFTHATDVYFGPGRYDPNSSAGKRLLAHELTHVVQQTGGSTSGGQLALGESRDQSKQKANQGARNVAAAGATDRATSLPVQPAFSQGMGVVQRSWDDVKEVFTSQGYDEDDYNALPELEKIIADDAAKIGKMRTSTRIHIRNRKKGPTPPPLPPQFKTPKPKSEEEEKKPGVFSSILSRFRGKKESTIPEPPPLPSEPITASSLKKQKESLRHVLPPGSAWKPPEWEKEWYKKQREERQEELAGLKGLRGKEETVEGMGTQLTRWGKFKEGTSKFFSGVKEKASGLSSWVKGKLSGAKPTLKYLRGGVYYPSTARQYARVGVETPKTSVGTVSLPGRGSGYVPPTQRKLPRPETKTEPQTKAPGGNQAQTENRISALQEELSKLKSQVLDLALKLK